MDIIAKKKAKLRLLITNKLKKLTKETFIKAGDYIVKNHLASFILSNNQKNKVAFFASLNSEISTHSLDELLRDLKIKRVLPYLINQQEMLFYPLSSRQNIGNLKNGPLGIKQPNKTNPISLNEISIIFVPGLLFDKKGYRLGRGKGHYDRLLASISQIKNGPILVGLALDMQIVPRLPVDDYDVAMDVICTKDLGIFFCKK